MQKMFETMPLDLQLKVCEKIVYPQSQELIDELTSVLVNRELMRLFHRGECPKLKPTFKDVQSEMLKIPGFVEIFVEQNNINRESDLKTISDNNKRRQALRAKFV
jgi:hypothetical protein